MKKFRKSSSYITPKSIPCIQFKHAVTNIEKAQLAVACKELHPKLLYIGTKNRPPPRPNPLKIPAITLFLATISIFCYTTFC